MLLSMRRNMPSTRGCLRESGSRNDGGNTTPIPLQERIANDGENDCLTFLRAGYCIFTTLSPAFTIAIAEDRRNALRTSPRLRNQSVSERQNRVERQTISGAPRLIMHARSRAVRLRSATLCSPEKFDKAPSNNAPGQMAILCRVSQATAEMSSSERKRASSPVLQLSVRIASPA